MSDRSYSVDPELMHYQKGQRASNHKYIAIKNGRYIYPEDNVNYNDRVTTAKKHLEYLEGGHARRLTNGDYTNMLDRRFRNREDVKKGGMGRPLYKRNNPDTGRPELVRKDNYNKYNKGGLRADYINPNSRRDTNFGGDTHHSDIVRPKIKKTEEKLNSRMNKAQSRYNNMVDNMTSKGRLTSQQATYLKETFDSNKKKAVDETMKTASRKYHAAAVKGGIIGRKIGEAPGKAKKKVAKTAKSYAAKGKKAIRKVIKK